MKRVWAIDVLECPRCQTQMQQVSALFDAAVIRKVAKAIEKATGPP